MAVLVYPLAINLSSMHDTWNRRRVKYEGKNLIRVSRDYCGNQGLEVEFFRELTGP